MFLRGLMGYLPSNILSAVVGVLTIVVFTRLLTPSEFGIYALAFSVLTLAHVGVFSWAEASMARYWVGASTPEQLGALYATLYRVVLVLSLVFIPLALLVCAWLPSSPAMRAAVALALIGVPVRCLLNMVKVALRARGAVAQAATLDMYFTLGVFIIALGAALGGMGGSSVLVGMLAVPFLALPFVLPAEWKKVQAGKYSAEHLRKYLAYGYPISLSLSMALILASTDRFMLGWLLDEAAVGAYHASYSIANRTLDILFIWLGMAGGPALVMALEKGGTHALKRAATDQAKTVFLITLPAAVGVALVARPLSEVVIGVELRSAATLVTPWIAASGFLSGLLYYYFCQAFTLSQRTRLLLLTMIFPAVANIAFNLILIPIYGLLGAAIATVLGYGIGVIASIIASRRVLVMPIPWKDVSLCGLCSAVMAVVVMSLPSWGGLPELLVDAATGATVYGALAYAVNAGGARDLIDGARHHLRQRRKRLA